MTPSDPEPSLRNAGALAALDAVTRMSEYADKGESWPDTIDAARHIIETDGLSVLVARLDAVDAEEAEDDDEMANEALLERLAATTVRYILDVSDRSTP